jgi:DNA-binding NarL/FixJ family response regulator
MSIILIIEDDNDFRNTLSGLFCERFPSTDLLEAVDGEQALAQLMAMVPDVVVTDLKLPGQNGLQVTRKIRGTHPHLPVIVLTSYHDPEYEEAAYAAGATHFVSKHTTSASEILRLVHSHLPDG